MNNQELEKMISAVGQWAEYNFDFRCPELGIVEELGEFAHARLKGLQGIRPESSTKEKMQDALGDAAIFLFDYCFLHDYKLIEVELSKLKFDYSSENPRDPIFNLGNCVRNTGLLLTGGFMFFETRVNLIWIQLNEIAISLNWDLTSIIQKTWNEVKTRDWRKFPTNGKDE